jgi:ketosteroid isomerase-like protein
MTTTNLQDRINTTNDAFLAALARGDAAAMADAYTENGAVLPTNSEIIRGKQAIQAFWQGALDGLGLKSAGLETVELVPHGDMAYEVGEYILRGAGGSVFDQGKYIVIWKQEAGQWKWHRDIFNSSLLREENA